MKKHFHWYNHWQVIVDSTGEIPIFYVRNCACGKEQHKSLWGRKHT